jgi:hypothetical protein
MIFQHRGQLSIKWWHHAGIPDTLLQIKTLLSFKTAPRSTFFSELQTQVSNFDTMPSTVSSFARRCETRSLTYPDHLRPGERLVRCRHCREPDCRGFKTNSADQRRACCPNRSWQAVSSDIADSVTVATVASSTSSRSRATTASTTTPAPRRSSTTRRSSQERAPLADASASTLLATRPGLSSTPPMALTAAVRWRLTRRTTAGTSSRSLSLSMLTSLDAMTTRASRRSSSCARTMSS